MKLDFLIAIPSHDESVLRLPDIFDLWTIGEVPDGGINHTAPEGDALAGMEQSTGVSNKRRISRAWASPERHRTGAKFNATNSCSFVPWSILASAVFFPQHNPGKHLGIKTISCDQLVSPVVDGDKSILTIRVGEQGCDKASPITHEWLRKIDRPTIDGLRVRPLVFDVARKKFVALISRGPSHSTLYQIQTE